MALLVWAASVLYLPALMINIESRSATFARTPHHHDSVARFVYTHIASPAALLSIAAGTAVFWLNHSLEFWLVAKLTLVTALAALHAAMGMLVLRVERRQLDRLHTLGLLLSALFCALLVTILWLVLAKPDVPESWPWTL